MQEYVSVLVRFSAYFIDSLIVGMPVGIVAALMGGTEVLEQDSFGLVLVLILYSYLILMESRSGQTVGKKIMKIKVVSEDGSTATLKQIVIRNLLGIFERNLIGAIAIWCNVKRKRLGDYAAGTIVVKV